MKSMTTLASSTKEKKYEILDNLSVGIKILDNPYEIPLESVFAMAARNNPKRSYLFVSKLLGKHIPVRPRIPFLTGFLLASRLAESLVISVNKRIINRAVHELSFEVDDYITWSPYEFPGKALFIGFAETATALGHSVFDCFTGDIRYLHTTRENLEGAHDTIYFTEDHCHAPDQRCLVNEITYFKENDLLVLIDDEITSGNTCLNIIKTIQKKYPQKQYAILTILDWRSEEAHEKYALMERELGVKLSVISLLAGSFCWQGTSPVTNEPIAYIDEYMPKVETCYEPMESKIEIPLLDGCSVEYLSYTGRFGIDIKDSKQLLIEASSLGKKLSATRKGKKTLCLGTGEFMYLPFLIASYMGEGVRVQSTTRSPVHPNLRQDYAVKHAITFTDPFRPEIKNFVYNIPPDYYDEIFVFWEREVKPDSVAPLIKSLTELGIKHIRFISHCHLTNQGDGSSGYPCIHATKHATRGTVPLVPAPAPVGSYSSNDVIFLLKEIGDLVQEQGNQEREMAIQSGRHYSEMLPIEYRPSKEYVELFYKSLRETSGRIALATGVVSEIIINSLGENVVLVSLARAGTPVGVLIKRYIKQVFGIDLPHYSISIIRDKGIDENALHYILQQHPDHVIQFIDGWTGKGAISKELIRSLKVYKEKYGITLNSALAVLADPGHCANIFGTRDDFLIPSACLNATVSGLMSRTVCRKDLIGELDFHGAKYYVDMADEDVSNIFIDSVASHFGEIKSEASRILKQNQSPGYGVDANPAWLGMQETQKIKEDFKITNINYVKPGVGETTRVLLRRVPWKVLVKDINNPDLKHVLLLAKDKSVAVEEYPDMSYSCCGLIKTVVANQ